MKTKKYRFLSVKVYEVVSLIPLIPFEIELATIRKCSFYIQFISPTAPLADCWVPGNNPLGGPWAQCIYFIFIELYLRKWRRRLILHIRFKMAVKSLRKWKEMNPEIHRFIVLKIGGDRRK